MDPAPLESLVNRLRHTPDHLVHGIVIAQRGKLVFEEYFPELRHPTFGETPVSYDCRTLHTLSSVTKSVTATLLGIAVARGMIADVNEPVSGYFPELTCLQGELKSRITLEHLVTLTSRLDWNEWDCPVTDPRNDLAHFMAHAGASARDAFDFVLAMPMVAAPGTTLRYGGGSFNVLGKIIQAASGTRLDEFARQTLFEPLGVSQVTWWLFADSLVCASGDISIRPRDLAKLGQLYLQDGRWGSQQLLPPEWVPASAAPLSTFPRDPDSGTIGYGHGWWIKGDPYGAGGFAAEVRGGQELLVLPEYDMVVVLTGGSFWAVPPLSPHQIVSQYVMATVGGAAW